MYDVFLSVLWRWWLGDKKDTAACKKYCNSRPNRLFLRELRGTWHNLEWSPGNRRLNKTNSSSSSSSNIVCGFGNTKISKTDHFTCSIWTKRPIHCCTQPAYISDWDEITVCTYIRCTKIKHQSRLFIMHNAWNLQKIISQRRRVIRRSRYHSVQPCA